MNKLFKKDKIIFFLFGIILLSHCFILTKLIYFPYPELFIYPYLTNHGLKPYAQILDQHFPGLMFFPVNLNNLGMTTPEIARIWQIAIVILIQIMLFLITKEIFRSKIKALSVNVAYLMWQPFFEGWILWIDSFLPLLLLPAIYALYKKKFFWAGILMGAAIVLKQVMIPLAIFLAIYLFWENKKIKEVGLYFLGLFFPVSLMLFYLFTIGAFNEFWYWTVIFNLTVYAQYGRGEGADFAHLSRVGLVFGTSLIVLWKIREKFSQILVVFLIGSLIGLSTRFDFVHFQPALPFALIATVYGLDKLRGLSKSGKILTIGYLLISIWWLNIFYKGHLGDKVILFDDQTKQTAEKIKQYTKPYEKIFIFGAAPHIYQMSNTLPAGDIFVFQFPWFLKEAERRILKGIEEDKPEIIVADRTLKIEDQPIVEFASRIDKYIQENYEYIDQVGSTIILRRKK